MLSLWVQTTERQLPSLILRMLSLFNHKAHSFCTDRLFSMTLKRKTLKRPRQRCRRELLKPGRRWIPIRKRNLNSYMKRRESSMNSTSKLGRRNILMILSRRKLILMLRKITVLKPLAKLELRNLKLQLRDLMLKHPYGRTVWVRSIARSPRRREVLKKEQWKRRKV